MTTTTTTPKSIIKVTEGVMAGDVFYGSFETIVKSKRHTVSVSNHLKDENKEYEFRIAGKCRAGFISLPSELSVDTRRTHLLTFK
jgi:hypothetical protein